MSRRGQGNGAKQVGELKEMSGAGFRDERGGVGKEGVRR